MKMKAWTHLVQCDEVVFGSPTQRFRLLTKAVEIDGKWRLAERDKIGLKYGQILTNVTIYEARKNLPQM